MSDESDCTILLKFKDALPENDDFGNGLSKDNFA